MFMQRLDQLCAGRVGEVVYLNVYNVTGINGCLEYFGFGLYHTSVGMYDLEFSFGGHDEASSGIVVVDKGNTAGLELKESLPVGVTHYSSDEVDEAVDAFGEFWHGKDYDPFAKNCNDFTENLIRFVTDRQTYYVPSYINRFTKLGSVFRMWFKPLQELVGDIVNYEEDSESDRNSHQRSSSSSDDNIERSGQPTGLPGQSRDAPAPPRIAAPADLEQGFRLTKPDLHTSQAIEDRKDHILS